MKRMIVGYLLTAATVYLTMSYIMKLFIVLINTVSLSAI
jgi:hypothetical protein